MSQGSGFILGRQSLAIKRKTVMLGRDSVGEARDRQRRGEEKRVDELSPGAQRLLETGRRAGRKCDSRREVGEDRDGARANNKVNDTLPGAKALRFWMGSPPVPLERGSAFQGVLTSSANSVAPLCPLEGHVRCPAPDTAPLSPLFPRYNN